MHTPISSWIWYRKIARLSPVISSSIACIIKIWILSIIFSTVIMVRENLWYFGDEYHKNIGIYVSTPLFRSYLLYICDIRSFQYLSFREITRIGCITDLHSFPPKHVLDRFQERLIFVTNCSNQVFLAWSTFS